MADIDVEMVDVEHEEVPALASRNFVITNRSPESSYMSRTESKIFVEGHYDSNVIWEGVHLYLRGINAPVGSPDSYCVAETYLERTGLYCGRFPPHLQGRYELGLLQRDRGVVSNVVDIMFYP